jgi:hypothetical protein
VVPAYLCLQASDRAAGTTETCRVRLPDGPVIDFDQHRETDIRKEFPTQVNVARTKCREMVKKARPSRDDRWLLVLAKPYVNQEPGVVPTLNIAVQLTVILDRSV